MMVVVVGEGRVAGDVRIVDGFIEKDRVMIMIFPYHFRFSLLKEDSNVDYAIIEIFMLQINE